MTGKPSPASGGEKLKTELEEIRKFLGPVAAQYSEEQLGQLRREMYAMAELLLDIYLCKKLERKESRKTEKDFDRPSPSP